MAYVAALVTVAATLAVPQAAAAAPPPARPGRTVTLVTGDQVSAAGDGSVRIERAAGREGVQFLTHQSGGHRYVIPSDALSLVTKGRLDRRLFDITALLELGYDRRADLPLIVTQTGGGAAARSTVTGARVDARLSAVDGLAVRVDRGSGDAFWRGIRASATSRVWLDGRRKVRLDRSVPQIGAPAAWQAGYDGSGVTVAVLDTGIDAAHPDLADRVAGRRNFTEGTVGDADRYGHGTHVASIVAGTGAASGGRYRGTAPGARLLDGKVCDDSGDCLESWILSGMQWAVEQGADVVNLSLGGPDTPELDPVEAAVNTLTEQHGTLFVIAAGNGGPGEMTVDSPGSADRALTVAAVDDDDNTAWFSGRGPRVGDGAIKPDIAAPGVGIVAAQSKDYVDGLPGESYLSMQGTSMASPHVAGAAAILAQRHPDWQAPQLKAALMGSAQPHAGASVLDQGVGRVDVARVIGQTVTADPPSVGYGNHPAPHDDDQPMPRTVTYTNHGLADTTLSLSLSTSSDLFTVDKTSVRVPAGGSAQVTVTADTHVSAPTGQHTGHLVAAAADGTVVRTPVAVSTSPLERIVTVTFTDHNGQPTDLGLGWLVRLDGPGALELMFGRVGRVRVPPGRYALMGWVSTESADGWRSALLARPRLDVTSSDPTVDLDARLARPITVSVPHASAGAVTASVGAEIRDAGELYTSGVSATSLASLSTAQLGPDTSDADIAPATFTGRVAATFAEPAASGGFDGSPYAYNLAWFSNGRLPTGLSRTVSASQLATVAADHARHTVAEARKEAFAVVPRRMEWQVSVGEGVRYPLPFQRTEYFNADGDARWVSVLAETGLGIFFSQPIRYGAGQRYTERWNRGVFGPSMPDIGYPRIARLGDFLVANVPLFGDGAGRFGTSPSTEARIALYRDGELIEEQPYTSNLFMGLPDGEAAYRLEVSADRGALAKLSTRVTTAWTFRSARVDHPAGQPVPLSAVVFDSGLDVASTAPAGRPYLLPVRVVPQPGSAAKPVQRLTVEVSFDDGATWRRVPVAAGAGTIANPAGAGYASLRASATDTAGNTVEQTIIRAYRFG